MRAERQYTLSQKAKCDDCGGTVESFGNKLGILEVGKEADVIVVNGDPIADLDALDQVQMTFIGGQKMLGVGN